MAWAMGDPLPPDSFEHCLFLSKSSVLRAENLQAIQRTKSQGERPCPGLLRSPCLRSCPGLHRILCHICFSCLLSMSYRIFSEHLTAQKREKMYTINQWPWANQLQELTERDRAGGGFGLRCCVSTLHSLVMERYSPVLPALRVMFLV